MAPLTFDILREYDAALVAKFTPSLIDSATGQKVNAATVDGVAVPVPIGVGMPEEWYQRVGFPYIAITRHAPIPDPGRDVNPAWVGQEISTSDPNSYNIQKNAPQPVRILYDVEILADNMAEFNALVIYLSLKALPLKGFGTYLTVLGKLANYSCTAAKDMTDYTSKDGRLFRYVFTYSVEAWLADLECVKVPQILHVDITVETYKDTVDIQATPAPDATTADEVFHITQDAPVP